MCHLFVVLQSLRLVSAWDHLPEETFRDTVAQEETVLVACEWRPEKLRKENLADSGDLFKLSRYDSRNPLV